MTCFDIYCLSFAAEIYSLVFILSFEAKTLQLFVFNQLSSFPSQSNQLNNNWSDFKSRYLTNTALLSKALWLVRTSFIIYPHSVCSTVSHHILQYMICPSDILRKGGGPAPNPVVPLLIGDVDTTPLKDKKNTLQPELWKCWDVVVVVFFFE